MRPILSALLAATALPAFAEPPVVVTDIAPVQSLVARIMEGSGGEVTSLLPPGASPHDFALRPSDARRLTDADLVVWIGAGLTPWLADPVESLSEGAVLNLLETEGWGPLEAREETGFDHDHGAEDDHDDHAEDAHGHGDIDPHAWLDPLVAASWATSIAVELSEIDRPNADLYRANSAAVAQDMANLAQDVAARLDGLSANYLVAHDAYRYLERRFGLTPVGAITLSDAARPGPRRIAELREAAQAGEVSCILTDPQSGTAWSDLVGEGTELRVVEADPLGRDLAPGPDLYPALIEGLAAALEECLSDEG